MCFKESRIRTFFPCKEYGGGCALKRAGLELSSPAKKQGGVGGWVFHWSFRFLNRQSSQPGSLDQARFQSLWVSLNALSILWLKWRSRWNVLKATNNYIFAVEWREGAAKYLNIMNSAIYLNRMKTIWLTVRFVWFMLLHWRNKIAWEI